MIEIFIQNSEKKTIFQNIPRIKTVIIDKMLSKKYDINLQKDLS